MTQATKFRTLFEHPTKIYEAPIFQRRYRWTVKTELPKFWEDFSNVERGEAETLFLGAIITKPSQPSTGYTAERELIVDGQQRLTTLSLTILAATVLAEEHSQKDAVNSLIEYLTISHRRDDIGRPKIIVTTPDLAEYDSLFRKLNNETKRNLRLHSSHSAKIGPLTHSFDYAKDEIKNRIEEAGGNPGDTIMRIIDQMLDKVEIVEFQLEERHDPNEVFDRLNRQGLKLTVADLARNHVFGKVSNDRDLANQLYGSQWRPFEEKFNAAVTDQVGKSASARGDALLDQYFFPFAITRFPQTTKPKSINLLEQRWNIMNEGETNPSVQVENIVEDLSEFVPAFLSLTTGASYPRLPKDVEEIANRLYRMKLPSVVLPFPMHILRATASGDIDPKNAREALEIVESFLVRRALVGIEPTGLHAIFKVLWGKTSQGIPSKVRENITSTTTKFPNDGELRQGIEGEALKQRRLCHYILEERELDLRGRGDDLSPEQLQGFEVDHIAPQSLKGDWAPLFASPDAEALLDTWGNLVPLSKKANTTKNARSWEDARKFLRLDTIYKSTRMIYEDHDHWDADTIVARNRELADWAITRWPFYEHYLKQ